MTEPTFAKLNSVIGDINSAQRLLNYVLYTIDSELIHRTNLPFWDHTDLNSANFEDDCSYHTMKLSLMKSGLKLSADCLLRPQHAGYRILDTPAEEEP